MFLCLCACVFYAQVYAALSQVPNMFVYAREEIPERFHFKGGKFVSPLTLLADPGWFITEVIWYMCTLIHNWFWSACKDMSWHRFTQVATYWDNWPRSNYSCFNCLWAWAAQGFFIPVDSKVKGFLWRSNFQNFFYYYWMHENALAITQGWCFLGVVPYFSIRWW